jgi:murein DD-endopeptidase MepM/ murein hydrolase activator NlpD
LKQALLKAGEQALSRAGHVLAHHPRQVTLALLTVMLGGGGGAYAVASLGPDVAAMPVRQVLEAVEPLPLESQADALQEHALQLFAAEAARGSDTVESLLARLGVNDPAAAAFLRQVGAVRTKILGNAGRTVRAEVSEDRNLVRLTAAWPTADLTKFERLVVERQPNGRFTSRIELAPYVTSLRLGSGTLRSSLFAAVDEARMPDAVAMQMMSIFDGDIDFHRGLRKGDRFHVVYEALEADGEVLRTGRVLTAEFHNAGRHHQALWFQQPGTAGGYYGFDGKSLERTFLASPMEVSRVTSGFAMRFHPIHHTWRAHTGVDYGAPTGAPVRTVADGRVTFSGWMNGYGNTVQIDHGRGDTTLYAHLSRIDVRNGGQVRKGDRIGAVGATGWATGPHLHFEFREGGVLRDPLEVARSRQSERIELTAQAKPEFQRVAMAMRSQLAAAASPLMVASAQ